MGKAKLFLYLSVPLFFFFFSPLGCWNLSAIIPGFLKCIIVHGSLEKSVFLWGYQVWIFLFHQFTEVQKREFFYFTVSQISSGISKNIQVVL